MGLFDKKFSQEQQAKLQEFTNTLNELQESCEEAIRSFKILTINLYHVCFRVLRENRELEEWEEMEFIETPGINDVWEAKPTYGMRVRVADGLVRPAYRQAKLYSDFLASTKAKVLSLRISDWYPQKYRKALDQWIFYLDAMLSETFMGFVLRGLAKPNPLKHDPEHGNDKLNMFVQGISLVYKCHQDCFPKRLS